MARAILLIVFFLVQAGNLSAAVPLEKDKLDATAISNNPFTQMQTWVSQLREYDPRAHIFIALATTWNGHPANRLTGFYKITNEGVVFFTNPRFNMVKHFHNDPLAAATIFFNTPFGLRQMRVEGKVMDYKEPGLPIAEVFTDKNNQYSANTQNYLLKPVWVQVSELRFNNDQEEYSDIEYRLTNKGWVIAPKLRELHIDKNLSRTTPVTR